MPCPNHFITGKDSIPIVHKAGWATGPVWKGMENFNLTGTRSPEHPAPSKSLYWLCSPCLPELSSKETKEMLDHTYSLKLSDMIITQQYLTTFQNHIIDSQWQQYSHCRKESAHLIQGIYKPCVYRHHIHFFYITAVKLVLKEYGSHWPSTCYALFCQKRSDYTTGIKNYCFLH